MFTIAKQSIINIRSVTDLQNAKNVRKFEFRGHGLRITLKYGYYSSTEVFRLQYVHNLLCLVTVTVARL